MNHGEARNERTETIITSRAMILGQNVATSWREEAVAERFCVRCDAWVETRGAAEAQFCPGCSEPWREHTRDEHCTFGRDMLCEICGVDHGGGRCKFCGARAFHRFGCKGFGG
ncbi:MAG: hypothetical protein GY769_17595 [bacterium]|nr:hypothetical protein [bacterium]